MDGSEAVALASSSGVAPKGRSSPVEARISSVRGIGDVGGEPRMRGGGGMGEPTDSASRRRRRVSWAFVGTLWKRVLGWVSMYVDELV